MANRDIQKIKNKINKNKRRALGTLTPEEVLFFLDYFGDNCAYSGTSLDKGFHIDHIIPVSMGGTTDSWNCIPLCETCNTSKRDKHLLDWWDENRKPEEEYKLEKVLAYILLQINKQKSLQIDAGNNDMVHSAVVRAEKSVLNVQDDTMFADKEVDTKRSFNTWMFLTQILKHLIDNAQHLEISERGRIKEGIELSGSKEFEDFICKSKSVKQRLQFYGLAIGRLYKANTLKDKLPDSVYKKQNELVALLKKYSVHNHYMIAFEYYDKVRELPLLQTEIAKMQEYVNGFNQDIGKLINRNPHILAMSSSEFVKNVAEIAKAMQTSVSDIVGKVELLNHSPQDLKNLIDFCNQPNGKISIDQLNFKFFQELTIDEIKEVVTYINQNYKYPKVCEVMPNIYSLDSKKFQNNLDKWLKKEERFFEESISFWDTYLKAEKRDGKYEGIPKVVVKNRSEYSTEEEYKADIVRCLNGIMSEEAFEGVPVGARLGTAKQTGYGNYYIIAFWNAYYGIDFLKLSEEQKQQEKGKWEQEQQGFWDAYLKAEKREGEHEGTPKVVVKDRSEYETEGEYKADIVRCLSGIIQNGEVFKGVLVGKVLNNVKQMSYKHILVFWNDYYGIDFLKMSEEQEQQEKGMWEKEQQEFWDAYLKAEKRDGKNEGVPKVVVKDRSDYTTEEEYKADIVRCLDGIIQTEIFGGRPVGDRFYSAKQGNNKRLLAFWNAYYGIDFLQILEEQEGQEKRKWEQEQQEFWDAYLKAEKREGKYQETPKVVVKDITEYETEEEYKADIVRCLNGMITGYPGEIFRGVRVGARRNDLKQGGFKQLLAFWNDYYGIDFLKEIEEQKEEENSQWEQDEKEFWDAYLRAEKREDKHQETPKVVVKDITEYETEEEYKADIVRCLNGMNRREIFRGVPVGARLSDLKQGEYKQLLAFWNDYYGIDFLSDSERIEFQDNVEFWDAYLRAEKREGECQKTPKVVVKDIIEYETEKEYKADIVRCLNGMIQGKPGEIFRGVQVGARLNGLKQGGFKQLLAFLNDYYGIDFLKMAEEHQKQEEKTKMEICKRLGIKYNKAIQDKNMLIIKANIEYVVTNFGEEYINARTLLMDTQHLKKILPDLKKYGIIESVITAPAILSLTEEELEERIKVLALLGRPIAKEDKKTGGKQVNSMLYASKSGYLKKYIVNNNIDLTRIDELLAERGIQYGV